MLPGGKIEPGEEPIQTAAREIFEEIGLELPLSELTYLDTLTAPAANEPGATVRCDVFIWSGTLDHCPVCGRKLMKPAGVMSRQLVQS